MDSGARRLELPSDSSVHCVQADLSLSNGSFKEHLEGGMACFLAAFLITVSVR